MPDPDGRHVGEPRLVHAKRHGHARALEPLKRHLGREEIGKVRVGLEADECKGFAGRLEALWVLEHAEERLLLFHHLFEVHAVGLQVFVVFGLDVVKEHLGERRPRPDLLFECQEFGVPRHELETLLHGGLSGLGFAEVREELGVMQPPPRVVGLGLDALARDVEGFAQAPTCVSAAARR